MKTCNKCGEIKELTEYHKNKNYVNGCESTCKICACAIKKAKRDEIKLKANTKTVIKKERYTNNIFGVKLLINFPKNVLFSVHK